jgi:hypothetical protein
LRHNSDLVSTFYSTSVDTRFPVEIHIVVNGTIGGIELDKDSIFVGVRVISNATQYSNIARFVLSFVQGDSFIAIPSELPALGGVETHDRTVILAIGIPHLQGEKCIHEHW